MNNPGTDNMIHIVAGNFHQARHYAKKKSIPPPFWTYVRSSDVVKGLTGSVVFTGTYYERDDKFEIAAEVEKACEDGKLKRLEEDG